MSFQCSSLETFFELLHLVYSLTLTCCCLSEYRNVLSLCCASDTDPQLQAETSALGRQPARISQVIFEPKVAMPCHPAIRSKGRRKGTAHFWDHFNLLSIHGGKLSYYHYLPRKFTLQSHCLQAVFYFTVIQIWCIMAISMIHQIPVFYVLTKVSYTASNLNMLTNSLSFVSML